MPILPTESFATIPTCEKTPAFEAYEENSAETNPSSLRKTMSPLSIGWSIITWCTCVSLVQDTKNNKQNNIIF